MKDKILKKIHALRPDIVEDCGISLDHVFIEIDESIQKDCFYTDIGERYITISAQEEKDLFYGLLDLLLKVKTREILKIGLSESKAVERGVHIDSGRKHYTKRWFECLIDLMALNKLNILQIHFSENLGYRLESKKYPDITSIEHLTIEDIKHLIAYAKNYYIKIIPSFDTPGHLESVLNQYDAFKLKPLDSALDITNKDARSFIKSLYDEILDIFETDTIHIGADEFINFDEYDQYPQLKKYAETHLGQDACAADTYVDYINDIGSYLMDKGQNVRVWNDGLYRLNVSHSIPLDPRFVITYWTSWDKNMAPLKTFIDKGHDVINFNDSHLYYVLGEAAGYTYPTFEKIKASFDPYRFSDCHHEVGDVKQELPEKHPQMKGTYFAVWSDVPEAQHENDVLKALSTLLVSYGEKLWKFHI